MRKDTILKGFLTGLFLQLAIGPVFIFILNLSLQYGLKTGLFAVLGVILVDYLFILLAIFGVGKLLEIEKISKVFSIISSIVLIIFGMILLYKGAKYNFNEQIETDNISYFQSFGSTFILTISSPLTILFWTSIFTSKSIEYSLSKKELIFFGLSAGFATVVFLGTAVFIFSFLNTLVPIILIKVLNLIVGLILVGFGVIRIIKDFKKSA